jgi:DNA-binding MarR family transcriptional regulator
MTGGRHQRWKLELTHPYYPHVAPPPLPYELESNEVLALWAKAARLRQSANKLLHRYGLTFSQWRVLHVTEALVRETGDMVSQLDIRRRAEMDATTASRLMYRLGRTGWLDHQPDCYDFAFRIFATDKAAAMLATTRPAIVQAAQGIWGPPLRKSA